MRGEYYSASFSGIATMAAMDQYMAGHVVPAAIFLLISFLLTCLSGYIGSKY